MRVARSLVDLAAVVALAAASLAGCSLGQAPSAGESPGEALRLPMVQSFGPEYPAAAAAGREVRIERAEISADDRTLTIGFIGGPGYLASDPCSTDYEPWVAARADELDVAVIEVARGDQATLAPNMACPSVGYPHTFHLALPKPFAGTRVNDVTGGIFFVLGPQDLATIVDLPDGWSQVRTFQQEPGPPPIWAQVYAMRNVAKNAPDEGPGHVVLYQAFGTTGEWSDTRAEKSRERGGTSSVVTVKGETQTLWTDAASGELLLAWTLDGRSMGIVGNTADMTAAQLVSIAEGVAIPAR